MKVAAMARKIEALYAWLESLTYQMCTMEHTEANMKIGDVMCLCKVCLIYFFVTFIYLFLFFFFFISSLFFFFTLFLLFHRPKVLRCMNFVLAKPP